MSLPPGLTDDDVTRIVRLIDDLQDVEVRIEVEGMKLHIRKLSGAALLGEPQAPLASAAADPRPTSNIGQALPKESEPAEGAGLLETEGEVDEGKTAKASSPDVMEIRAPMLGRFFRAPSPTEPPYVEVGSKVEPNDTVCVIEVMKLFNTVKAGVRGTIVGTPVENGAMVEYDGILFFVKPE